MADAAAWWADDPVIGAQPADPSNPWGNDQPEDKYRAAAIEEYNRLSKSGAIADPTPTGYTARAIKGVGMGWADDIAAGSMVPFEMIKRGLINPAEAYRYTRAREDVNAEKLAQNTQGVLGGLSEAAGIVGGATSALGSGTRAGAYAIPRTAATIPASVMNTLSNVGRGAAYGGVIGAGEAPTMEDMARGAVVGGAMGGVLGGVVPMAVKSLQGVAGAAQLPRLYDPERVATGQLAEVLRSAGMTPQQVAQEVANANAAGQPFTVADALGKEGQRKLAAMAKVPGPQRDAITETLTARNLNMPDRVGAQVGTALGAPTTAHEASQALVNQAGTQAAPLYRAAEQIPTWSPRLQQFLDDPIARSGLRQGVELQRLRTVGSDRPFNPRDAMITGFDEAGDPIISGVPNMQTLHTLKVGLDRMIESEVNPQTQRLNARGQALTDYKNRLLAEIDVNNPVYAQARRTYGGPMEVNAAVRQGQQMPSRGRFEDTVANFNAMPPTAQQGVRIGYADAVRAPLERTGNFPTILREKSAKGANELDALSLYQGPNQPGAPSQLRQLLNREEEMQRTSKAALGGSSTAENLADIAAGPGGTQQALGLVSSAAAGNPMGFARNAIDLAQRIGKGESEAQRVAITRQLLANEPDQVQAMARRIAEHEATRRGLNPTSPWSRVRAPRYSEGQ